MNREKDLLYEDQAPRDRLSRLSEASVYNNESLAIIVALQKVAGNARCLISARYSVTSMDESTCGGSNPPSGARMLGTQRPQPQLENGAIYRPLRPILPSLSSARIPIQQTGAVR